MTRRLLLTVILVLAIAGTAMAALQFPALTGRVVDDAHILSADTRQSLEQTLEDFEKQTTNQVVVATLPSLQGTSIEDYGYQLGRVWGIGKKGKDNGALLIVAPNERKVRIEVGYKLEPILTDAISSLIIQNKILPAFRKGQMEQGIVIGVGSMIDVLNGKPFQPSPNEISGNGEDDPTLPMLFVLLFIIFIVLRAYMFPYAGMGRGYSGYISRGSFGGFGGGGFGGGSGGFSGGGGSFGGGGASGGW